MAANNIQYLQHHEIDFYRWDCAIKSSLNAKPYALSWYLDAVSPQWDAMVLGDYEAIMPLPAKKKCGIKYFVQPLWTQQLGIFSSSSLTQDLCNRFLKRISCRMYAMKLNHANTLSANEERINLVLPLNETYSILFQNFHKNTQRNILKAHEANLQIEETDLHTFFDFWHTIHPKQTIETQTLKKLAEAALQNNAIQFLAAIQNGQIISAVMLIKDCKRIIFLAPGSNETGKEHSAMFSIVDHIIQSNAQSDYTLDFEGSQISGVRRFYEGFGAKQENYYYVEHLHPHWLVNLLHR